MKIKARTQSALRKLLEEKYFPFDIDEVIDQHFDVLKKYLSKNTLKYEIDDLQFEDDEMPDSWKFLRNDSILSTVGARNKNKNLSLLHKLEYIKCSLDAVYFSRKYIKITSIDDGIIPFNMYKYQEDMIQLFQENRLCIAVTGRQQGKTTTSASYILWFSIFHDTKQSAVLANKADQAQEIMERIQVSYELLPVFIKPGVKVYNKRSMTLENGSKAFSGASSISSIRGKSISLLYWDEAAWTPNDFAFYESVLPTLSSGKKSKMIMTSTPNGSKGVFYKIWSEREFNGFASIKVTWDMIPSRDERWKQEMISASSESAFRQEHCCEFRSSQNSLIAVDKLERLVTQSPVEEIDDLKIYHYPKENHQYIATVDTSRGVGGDYHATIMIDVTTKPYEVVATYRNNTLSPLIYPSLIYNIATKYNDAQVLIEINDIGEQTANILYYDLEYENVLGTITEKNRQIIGFGHDAKMGVRTTTAVKAVGCSTIKTMIEKEQIIINDFETVNEFGTFVPKGRSYEADTGCHDDLVMCLVLFAWATTQKYFIELTDTDFRTSLLSEMNERAMESIAPFGIIENDFGEYTGDIPDKHSFGIF